MTRICNYCKEEKDISEFRIHNVTKKYGYQCKKCIKKRHDEWVEKNRDKIRKWALDFYYRNQEKRKQYSKQWAKNNPDKNRKIVKRTRAKNRDWYRKYAIKYYQEVLKFNPMYKLNRGISEGINDSLRGNKNGRHWEDLVGYKLNDLKKHLEKQFTNGMSWDNYGQWHIDHRIPISAFNFKNYRDIDFHKCWSLDNLQPLWSIDNLKKYNKIDKPFQPFLALG